MHTISEPVLAPLLNLLEIGLAIHDERGLPLFANESAQSLLVTEREEVDRTIRAALSQKDIGVVASGAAARICSVATGSYVFTFFHRADQVNLRLSACMFGLTPTEKHIASLLARQYSPPDRDGSQRLAAHGSFPSEEHVRKDADAEPERADCPSERGTGSNRDRSKFVRFLR